MACPLFEFRLYMPVARTVDGNRADVLPELGIVSENEARKSDRHTFTYLIHAKAPHI